MTIELNKQYKIKKSVKHQGIGGKKIIIERILTPDDVDNEAMAGNWACYNFCLRRHDFLYGFDKKLYYGHVDFLGYVVCEDELEIPKNNLFRKVIKKLWKIKNTKQ